MWYVTKVVNDSFGSFSWGAVPVWESASLTLQNRETGDIDVVRGINLREYDLYGYDETDNAIWIPDKYEISSFGLAQATLRPDYEGDNISWDAGHTSVKRTSNWLRIYGMPSNMRSLPYGLFRVDRRFVCISKLLYEARECIGRLTDFSGYDLYTLASDSGLAYTFQVKKPEFDVWMSKVAMLCVTQ